MRSGQQTQPPPGPVLSDGQAEKALQTLLRFGSQLFVAGASSDRIKDALVSVRGAWGLRPIDFDVNVYSIHAQHEPSPGRALTRMQVLGVPGGMQLNALVVLERLADDVVHRGVGPAQAARKLDEVAAGRTAYPWWVRMLAAAPLASMLSLLAGGTALVALLAPVIALAVQMLGRLLALRGVPAFFTTAAQTFLVIAGAAGLAHVGVLTGAQSASIAAGNMILLLPIFHVLALTEDAARDFFAVAWGRLGVTVVQLGALFGGAAVALPLIAGLSGDLRDTAFPVLPVGMVLLSSAIGAMSHSIFMGGSYRLIPWAVGTALVGASANLLLTRVWHAPVWLAMLGAAALMVIAATFAGLRPRIPTRAMVLPGLTAAVLPGPDAYRSLLHVAFGMPGAPGDAAQVVLMLVALGLGTTLGGGLAVTAVHQVRRVTASGGGRIGPGHRAGADSTARDGRTARAVGSEAD